MLIEPWSIQLLGRSRATQAGREITRFRTQKTASLFAYLAHSCHRPHPRGDLVELFWPEEDPEAGRNSLRVALNSLRHQLEPPGVPKGSVLLADRSSVQLNPAAITTDVAAFETALQAAARARDARERAQRLTEAVTIYHGELLPGHFDEWVLRERQRLAEAFLNGLEQLLAHLEQTGDLPRALQCARRAVSADPLREEAHRDLIRLLAAVGQPEAALRQYGELERLLEAELGDAPGAETRALAREIEEGIGRRGERPSADSVSRASHTSSALRSGALAIPTGTITVLRVGITGDAVPGATEMPGSTAAPEELRTLLRSLLGPPAVDEAGGEDPSPVAEAGWQLAFGRVTDALSAAVAAQRALAGSPWATAEAPPPVRMALHTGEVEPDETADAEAGSGNPAAGHGTPVVTHADRLLRAAHPGQILLSEKSAALLRDQIPPGLQLVDLGSFLLRDDDTAERLFQLHDSELAPRSFPPPNAPPAPAASLPLPLTRFFGREREIARLSELLLLPDTRLVTLTGPGGTGKTRLAVEVATCLQERLHGAVCFVPLADLANADLVLDKTLTALHLPRSPQTDPLEQVVTALSRRPSLLLFDNFEHLVDEGALLVQMLLERVPTLTILATSRQRLNLSGEREFPVLALPTPGEPAGGPEERENPEGMTHFESVRLFVDRAQAVRPDFQVTRGNAAAVGALCERLEGIPLALELAAARVQVLTPSQMLDQLQRPLDFLVSRQRGAAPRHRSLRATLDWSYQLLAPELRSFFAKLSRFRGGWSLEAAVAVCEEPAALDCLEELRENSLVLVEEQAAVMRYRLLETLREFAAEQLAPEDQERLAHRHASYYATLAETAEPELRGPDQGLWLERLETEHENMRAALGRAVERGETELGLRLGGALSRFWSVRGYVTEGRNRLVELMALPEAAAYPAARAKTLHGAGVLAQIQGDYDAARALYGESLDVLRELDNKPGIASALNNLGQLSYHQSDYETARSLYEQGLAIRREIGDRWGIASSLNNLGGVAQYQGDYTAARALYEECLQIARELGEQWGITLVLGNLGKVAEYQGDYETARVLYEECLVIERALGDKQGIAYSTNSLGNVALYQGDHASASALYEEGLTLLRELGDQQGIANTVGSMGMAAQRQGDSRRARELYLESLALSQEIGDRLGIASCLEGLAWVAGACGQAARAARVFGAAASLREALGAPLPPADRADNERHVAAARDSLGEEPFAAAWAEGRAMSMAQAVADALADVD
jgi:predicted ATPase/DNA-binding SARP family transcriptional activator/Tfp pilus assembly protein PilF